MAAIENESVVVAEVSAAEKALGEVVVDVAQAEEAEGEAWTAEAVQKFLVKQLQKEVATRKQAAEEHAWDLPAARERVEEAKKWLEPHALKVGQKVWKRRIDSWNEKVKIKTKFGDNKERDKLKKKLRELQQTLQSRELKLEMEENELAFLQKRVARAQEKLEAAERRLCDMRREWADKWETADCARKRKRDCEEAVAAEKRARVE